MLGSGNDNQNLIQPPAKWKRDCRILVSPATRTVAAFGAIDARLLSLALDLLPAASIARSGHYPPPLDWRGRSRRVLVVLRRRGRQLRGLARRWLGVVVGMELIVSSRFLLRPRVALKRYHAWSSSRWVLRARAIANIEGFSV
jgi:hypothetical protein